MSSETPIIALDQVSKTFRRHNGRGDFLAVDRLSFAIKRGEIVAVLGQTGCGKSTVFNLIAGLIEPSNGTVLVLGHNAFRNFDFFRGKIGIVFQGDRLMPWRTALENVLLGLEILDADPKQARETARSWLNRLGLSGHENDYPHALSGGMRQRVSIARAFAIDPEILLCDEPFSALDEKTADDLRTEFSRLVRQNNKTAVFVTHSINEALQIGDRILVFHRPARIALEANLASSGTDPTEKENIRQQILGALAAGATEASQV
jgi:NitT/TauT family transport system ATP-binding protein